MNWAEVSFLVVMGLTGSGHCVGMCGGFALAVGRGADGAGGLFARHLAYQTGKTLTYVFLAVLLAAGLGWVGRAGALASAQTAVAIVAGAIMALYGLALVLEVRSAGWWRRLLEPIPACRAFVAVSRAPGPVAAFAIGWLNGFLPCGLLLAVLFHLASLHSVAAAAIGAAVFGAATLPGLFLFGLAAHAWNPSWRRGLLRAAGVMLIVFAAVTVLRAFPEGRHWLHGVLPDTWQAVREWCGF